MVTPESAKSQFHEDLPLQEDGRFTSTCSVEDLGLEQDLLNAQRLFRVRSGQAYITRETDAGVVPITCLQKGDYFGHIPFLDLGQEPFSASVLASPNLKLSSENPLELRKEHDKLSSTLKNILAHLSTSISVTTLTTCEFYKKVFAANSK